MVTNRVVTKGVATGGATGTAAPPIIWKKEENNDIITLLTPDRFCDLATAPDSTS